MENPPTASTGSERTDRLSEDRRFELLSDEHRRYVVAYLQEATAPVAVADIADRIAERESGGSPDRETVRYSLYHCHLPKLADAGVVTHDRDRNTVEPGDDFEHVADLLDSLPAGDDQEPER